MANLDELDQYDAGVYQIETFDRATGGANGKINAPLKNLANRTKWLKNHMAGPVFNVLGYGAINTGIEADKTTNKAAIDAAIAAAYAAGGGTVLFPPGTYFVDPLIYLQPGVDIVGYGATLKRPANQTKFQRMLSTQASTWSSASDSPIINIRGLTLDGNRANQGAYTSYELEHQHLIFLMCGDATTKGRLRVNLTDLDLKECVADGISQYINTDVNITNCRAWNCWRGGLVITGGWSKCNVVNFFAGGDVHKSGIDIEIDASGYNGEQPFQTMLNISNAVLDGDLDLGLNSASNSRIVVNNLFMKAGPFNVACYPGNSIRIANSELRVGVQSGSTNRIVKPYDVEFSNCVFKMDPETPASAHALVDIYWSISSSLDSRQRLKFNNCKFFAGTGLSRTGDTTSGSANVSNVSNMVGIFPGMPVTGAGVPAGTTVLYTHTSASGTTVVLSANATATATGVALTFGDGVTGATYGIYSQAISEALDNQLILNGCEFMGQFSEALRLGGLGGCVAFINNTTVYDAVIAYKVFGNLTYMARVVLNNARAFGCTAEWLYMGSNDAGNYVEFQNMQQSAVIGESATYDGDTSYSEWDTVSDGSGGFFVSQANANLGNALTDYTKWRRVRQENISFVNAGTLFRKRGNRVILTGVDPTTASTPGLLGDIRQFAVVPTSGAWRWICTVEHNTAATWRVLEYVLGGTQAITAASGTVLATSSFVTINRVGAVAVTLPASTYTGPGFTVKDISGTCSPTNVITFVLGAGTTLETAYELSEPYDSITWYLDGTVWRKK